jgi:RNA polymerase sigma factor (sigma-70 family)
MAGDEEAYSRIYRTYIQDLYRYALRYTSDAELARDCIQELFTTIYKNRKRLPIRGSVKAYLFVSLRNNLVRAVRRESFFRDAPGSVSVSIEQTVEDMYVERELREIGRLQLKRMLALLTLRQREIIYHRYIEGMSLDEICLVMNLNYQSAQNLIQRSLKKIRNVYKE